MNQLQAIAVNEGVRRKRGLWTQRGRAQLEALTLPPWATRCLLRKHSWSPSLRCALRC
jgi:hypothetical protein